MGKKPIVAPYSGAMLATRARSATFMLADRRARRYSTNLSTTPSLRRICVTVSTRSVAVAPGGKLAAELEADHLGGEHVERLAEHDGLGLDAAHAPAHHAQAVDHRGVAVGAHQRVGQGDRPGGVLAQEHALGQELQVHLVDDADAPAARRGSCRNAFWPQRRNS